MLSFTDQVKNELTRLSLGKSCCQRAELAALIQVGGSLSLKKEGFSLQIITTHASVARRAFRLIKSLFTVPSQVIIRQQNKLRKNKSFLLSIHGSKKIKNVMCQLGLHRQNVFFDSRLPAELIASRCCRRSYLRGAFLASGSLSRPEGGGYHLEITTTYEGHALALARLIKSFDFQIRCFPRKNHYVLYSKNSESIADFLRLIGAHAALLRFESARVYKGFRNKVNRLVNCETANLTKTVNASQSQIEDIIYLQKNLGFDNLSPALRHVARLRLQYPEASLRELGQLSSPPLSKSCVNHRLRRLKDMARNLQEKSTLRGD